MVLPTKSGYPLVTTRTGFPQVCASIQTNFERAIYILDVVLTLLTNLEIPKGFSFFNSIGSKSFGQS